MAASADNLALLSQSGKTKVLSRGPDDVVVVAAGRTAITKSHKGGFKDTRPEEYLSAVLRAVYAKVNLDPALIEDVVVGNVLAPKGGAGGARMAALHAGIPHTSAVNGVNRQCSSGLAAINQVANEIATGQIDIGIGAGYESMTFGAGARQNQGSQVWSKEVLANEEAKLCLQPTGIVVSENVASEFSISRQAQDEFSAASFQKAAAAQAAGKFVDEIVPVKVKQVNRETGEETLKTVDADDGIRAGVTVESLSKLKPAFLKDGTTHAGNSSQVSDGAAAVLLARRSVAAKLGLPILGKFVNAAVIGVPPRIVGVGPLYAIPKVLEKVGLTKDDVDFFEINEAFASQVVYCVNGLGIPYEKVNINGGAIAFGHPLGATGARQVATGYNIAKQTGAEIFVTSMCSGGGLGMAAVFTSEI